MAAPRSDNNTIDDPIGGDCSDGGGGGNDRGGHGAPCCSLNLLLKPWPLQPQQRHPHLFLLQLGGPGDGGVVAAAATAASDTAAPGAAVVCCNLQRLMTMSRPAMPRPLRQWHPTPMPHQLEIMLLLARLVSATTSAACCRFCHVDVLPTRDVLPIAGGGRCAHTPYRHAACMCVAQMSCHASYQIQTLPNATFVLPMCDRCATDVLPKCCHGAT